MTTILWVSKNAPLIWLSRFVTYLVSYYCYGMILIGWKLLLQNAMMGPHTFVLEPDVSFSAGTVSGAAGALMASSRYAES